MPQSYTIDYPILAYKSFTSENNEIVLSSLGVRDDRLKVLNLDNWRFLCFVNFPKSEMIRGFNASPLLSHICMLVKHRATRKIKIMIIEVDPWCSSEQKEQTFQAFFFHKVIHGL